MENINNNCPHCIAHLFKEIFNLHPDLISIQIKNKNQIILKFDHCEMEQSEFIENSPTDIWFEKMYSFLKKTNLIS